MKGLLGQGYSGHLLWEPEEGEFCSITSLALGSGRDKGYHMHRNF